MIWLKRIIVTLLVVIGALWAFAFLTLQFSSHEYAQLSVQQKTAAKEYLQGKLTPQPEDWQWNTFYPQPDVPLRTGVVRHPHSKGMVIVVPGYTGTIEMIMREIVQIHEAGFSVAAIEYRGQGASWRPLSNPEKGYVRDYAELADDLARFARSVDSPELPLFFYSISKGAHITVRMALTEGVDVSAFALVVPMIKINTGDFPYDATANIARGFTMLGLGAQYAPGQADWPGESFELGVATGCNANADLAQSQSALFAEQPLLRVGGTTMKWLKETMESTAFIQSTSLKDRITAPVKVFTAGIDELVDTKAAQEFCNALANCVEVHKPAARHCITREDMTVYDSIIQESIRHFEANIPDAI